MKGRVAELRGYGRPVEIAEYEVPDPEPGGLVVKIEQAAICGSDLHIWRGDTTGETATPAALGFGHEGFGRVVALGPGTTTDSAGRALKVGDRVVHHVMAGHSGRGPNPNAKTYGQFPYFFTTFADYYWVGASRPIYRVPDELPDDVLPPVNCAMGAAINGLIAGGTTFGSRVVVFGAGGLGLTAVAAAKDMGATTVIVLDRSLVRLSMAKQFGADHVINVDDVASSEQRVALVRDQTDGSGADVVLEVAGVAALLPEGVSMLGRRGTFVEIGLFYPGTSVPFDPSTLLRGEKRVIGSAGYPASLLPAILDFLVRVRDTRPFDRMVSHRFPLARIDEALSTADSSRSDSSVTRAVLQP